MAEFVARTFENTDFSSPIRFIWSHVRRHPVWAFLMVLGAFSNAALASVVPIVTGTAVEGLLNNEGLGIVLRMCLLVIASQFIRGILQFMRNTAAEVFAQRIERDVRDELYVSLLGKSMAFHDFQPVGEIMARVTNDVREVNYMISPGFNLIVGSGMFAILPLLVSPTIAPALFLVPALFLIIYVILQFYYVQSLQQVAQEVRSNFGRMNARLAETLDGIEVVKGTAQESHEIKQFNGLVDLVKQWFIKRGNVEAKYYANLLLGLTVVAGFLHAIYLYRAGVIDTGDVIGFMGQISLFGFPVFSSLFSFSQVASGLASAERILNIINSETHLDQNEKGYKQPVAGEIEFSGVNFGYLGDRDVLHDVSFKIKAGQTVAIVGQTGAGKSTLTKLINRTYDVDSGQVLVDGMAVREWNLAALRSQISIIEQEIFLFSRSISDNIRFGRPDASQEEVEAAAQKAQAHEFITSFPEGYDTVIGQRGVTLSGGQRQRLAIARAFLTNPHILILDDSTSAIDSATEDRIQKAIWAAAKGRTTILITHRLSQIRWADWILVMRKGQIVAQGTHESLMESSEQYRRIFVRYDNSPDAELGA